MMVVTVAEGVCVCGGVLVSVQEDGARVGNVLWCLLWDEGTMEGRRTDSPPIFGC